MTEFPRLPNHLFRRTSSVDEMLSDSWDRKLAADLAAEIETATGEKMRTMAEMRRFLALKGYRELMALLREASADLNGVEALGACARTMRSYAVARPALSAASFRTAMADCPDWRAAHDELHDFMIDVFGGCGLEGQAAEDALNVLRSLVRGFVLNETMHTLIGAVSHDDLFETAVRMFVAGLPALVEDPAAGMGCAPATT